MFKKTGILIGVYLFVKQMNIFSSQLKKKIRAWNKLERFAGTSSSENSVDETQTVPDKKDCKEQSETGSQLILRPSTSTNSEPEADKKKEARKKKLN